MKDDAVPVVCPTRKSHFGLQDKLKNELDSMEAKQVICRVTEPSNWVHSLVCVGKPNGKLRVCLDPEAFNDIIKRPYYPMRMSGANYFSVLDMTKGYWAVRLDNPSSMLRDESFNIRSVAGYICGGGGCIFWPSTWGGGGRKQINLGAGVGGGGIYFLYFLWHTGNLFFIKNVSASGGFATGHPPHYSYIFSFYSF